MLRAMPPALDPALAGFLHDNTEEEADRLCDALAALAAAPAGDRVRRPRRDEAPA